VNKATELKMEGETQLLVDRLSHIELSDTPHQ
jgi:hypothetical protein